MAWDSTRTVPWRRLIREWLIYAGLAAVVMVLYFAATDRSIGAGLFAGLIASGPMYLLFAAVLAKFGYQRKTFRELRAEREALGTSGSTRNARGRGDPVGAATTTRPKPLPTKRTSSGPSHHRKGTNKPKRR